MDGSENAIRLFLQGFSARDIAEALPSFDENANARMVCSTMDERQFEVIGIRRAGMVAGWLTREDLVEATVLPPSRPIETASAIGESASFDEILRKLDSAPCLFVLSLGQVSGVIRQVDLQKPPVRMWLFGLVTITEIRVTRLIEECCPEASWQQYISAGRLHKAQELQRERRRRNQHRRLLECLQLADKGRIVARDATLRERTQFSSQREVEEFVKALQDLRNNLAHSQDLSDDWSLMLALATNLHRVVLGPIVQAAIP